MKRRFLLVAALAFAFVGVVTVLPNIAFADSPSPAAAANSVSVDVTVSSTGNLTIGGIDLKALGVAPLDSATVEMVKNLDNAHVVVQGDAVTIDLHGTPAFTIQWNQASRKAVVDLAAKYGYAVTPEVMSRIEEWISSSNVDVTARYTNNPSKPLSINMSKMLWVDLGANGEVAVEKGPLAYGIDPSIMPTIKQAGVGNATVCWSKGNLLLKADGKNLPTITVDPKGAAYLTKALNLAIDNLDPFFAAQIGVDVSLPGGSHQATATCGQ